MSQAWEDKLKLLLAILDDKKNISESVLSNYRAEAVVFINTVIIPAFQELRDTISKFNRSVVVSSEIDDKDLLPNAELIVYRNNDKEFNYTAKVLFDETNILVHLFTYDPLTQKQHNVKLKSHAGYFIHSLTKEMIINSFINEYSKLQVKQMGI